MKSDRYVECDNEEQVKSKGKSKITAKNKNKPITTEEVPQQAKSKVSKRNPRLSVRNEEEMQIVYDSGFQWILVMVT